MSNSVKDAALGSTNTSTIGSLQLGHEGVVRSCGVLMPR